MTADNNNSNNLRRKTPPGYNKRLRNICKFLLMGTCLSLLANFGQLLGVILAAGAFIVVKQGTVESAKNWKWGILSVATFVASLVSYCLSEAVSRIDGERAYEFKTKLWFYGTFIRTVGGGVLALFLLSDVFSQAQATEMFVEQRDAKLK